MVTSVIAETMHQSLHIRTCSFYRLPLARQHKETIQYLTSTVQDLTLLKYPHIGPQSIIFEVISVISVVISVSPVISVNRRTQSFKKRLKESGADPDILKGECTKGKE